MNVIIKTEPPVCLVLCLHISILYFRFRGYNIYTAIHECYYKDRASGMPSTVSTHLYFIFQN